VRFEIKEENRPWWLPPRAASDHVTVVRHEANRGVGLLLLVLGAGGVHVDVLLAGEPHDLVHDLVGDRAQDVAVVLQALVALEVERLAEAHDGSREGAELLARRRDLVGADHGDRDHRHSRLEGEPGDAGLAAVEPAVVRAGALGVDAEEVTLGQDPLRRHQRPLGGRRTRPVDRHLAGPGEEHLLEPALDAGGGEVLGLGDEGDPPRHGQGHEQPVGVGQVVARQDRRALGRDVLDTVGLRPEEDLEQRSDGDEFQEPVEQLPATSLDTSPGHPNPSPSWGRVKRWAV